MRKLWIFIGISGVLAVIMGAMSAHMLKAILPVQDIARIQTSAMYQLLHTLILAVLALYYAFNSRKIIVQSAWIFGVGIVLFSGSLYLYTFSKIQALIFVTPVGGLLLILGWLSLIRLGIGTNTKV